MANLISKNKFIMLKNIGQKNENIETQNQAQELMKSATSLFENNKHSTNLDIKDFLNEWMN